MDATWLLPTLIWLPAVCAAVGLTLRSPRAIVRFCAAGTLAVTVVAAIVSVRVFRFGVLFAAGRWMMLDALSAFHMLVMMAVFSLSALYAVSYFREEIARGEFSGRAARRYNGLWFGSLAAMALVLAANNIGLMWVGIEATTLLTAFLICLHPSRAALEAMWKYLLMCSVGVAIAFTGTLLIAASTGPAAVHGNEALLWTTLREVATRLDPLLLKAGFIFLVVGYGTKAGLAPMHNWLPDAHSQAPAPVSAIFSGFLLNAALYGIIRCLPIVEMATGNVGWGRGILVVLGMLSIWVAAIFIVTQHDVKRLLAYSSVEHIGVMALGVGLGGLGAFAALFHMLNSSVSKSVSFFSAGSLGQICGGHEMGRLSGAPRLSRSWGVGLIGTLLALIGVAPFAIFLSEFMILKAAVDGGMYGTAALFLAGLGVVFVGALRHVIPMAWGPTDGKTQPRNIGILDSALVFVPLVALAALGLWMPPALSRVIEQAAGLLGGGR